MERGGQYYYYHADGLGSVTAISDAARTVVQRYSYSVFGQPRPTTDFRNSYQYTGREYDKETGLYYYRARYYDPIEERFIQKDPIGFAGGDVNLFGYVQNNPANATDPTGLTNFFVRPWWNLFRFPRLGPPPPPANWPKPPNWAPEWQWKYPECSTPKTQPLVGLIQMVVNGVGIRQTNGTQMGIGIITLGIVGTALGEIFIHRCRCPEQIHLYQTITYRFQHI